MDVNAGKEANTNSEHSCDNPFDAILRQHEAKVELDRMPRTGATNKDISQRPAELMAPGYETRGQKKDDSPRAALTYTVRC